MASSAHSISDTAGIPLQMACNRKESAPYPFSSCTPVKTKVLPAVAIKLTLFGEPNMLFADQAVTVEV